MLLKLAGLVVAWSHWLFISQYFPLIMLATILVVPKSGTLRRMGFKFMVLPKGQKFLETMSQISPGTGTDSIRRAVAPAPSAPPIIAAADGMSVRVFNRNNGASDLLCKELDLCWDRRARHTMRYIRSLAGHSGRFQLLEIQGLQ